ncbi:MAG: hypothetical protein O3A60_05350 [Planctomycetota bacterium]|nr:hypothetical protein [Planctomycetota bacterium]
MKRIDQVASRLTRAGGVVPQSRAAVALPVRVALMIAGVWAGGSGAAFGWEPHRCDACGRELAMPMEGMVFTVRRICGPCYREADHRWRSIDRNRYASFSDGTMVDLKHFRASMLVSQTAGVGLGRAGRGIAAANLAGWAVEWTQAAQGHVGGQPFGGNEDLYSNFAGSLFGQVARLGGGTADWAERAIGLLERFHGPLHSVSDTK